MTVTIVLRNFRLAPPQEGQANETHFGHYHLQVKQTGLFRMFFAETSTPTIDHSDPKGVFKTAAPGSYEPTAALAHHSHAALSPPVERRATFVITP